MEYRIEHDLLGEREIPKDALWGIHTLRARENFPISNLTVSRELILSMAQVKKACALTNKELGYLARHIADAVLYGCDEIIAGKYQEDLVLDALQGGAGTSTNMMMNEVIANCALQSLGMPRGLYTEINPHDHVNMHQSTNDVYPTAVKITAIRLMRKLALSIEKLQGTFQEKEKEFHDVRIIGRTEMQEAVPLTLGAQCASFADAFARDRWRTFKCEERLRVINLGGTAIGTGMGAPRDYIFMVTDMLREITGFGLSRGEHVIDQTANTDVYIEVHGMLKACASNLMKITHDLRYMESIGYISIPPCQAGSSIMPGKVNPVLLEAAIQVGIKVFANDLIIAETVSRSTLNINEFMPLCAYALIESLEILTNITDRLATWAQGIRADRTRCERIFEESLTLFTAFVPHIGYEKATRLRRMYEERAGKSVYAFLGEHLELELIERVLSPESLTALGYTRHG